MTSLLGYFQDGAGLWPESRRRRRRTVRDLNNLPRDGDAFLPSPKKTGRVPFVLGPRDERAAPGERQVTLTVTAAKMVAPSSKNNKTCCCCRRGPRPTGQEEDLLQDFTAGAEARLPH